MVFCSSNFINHFELTDINKKPQQSLGQAKVTDAQILWANTIKNNLKFLKDIFTIISIWFYFSPSLQRMPLPCMINPNYNLFRYFNSDLVPQISEFSIFSSKTCTQYQINPSLDSYSVSSSRHKPSMKKFFDGN